MTNYKVILFDADDTLLDFKSTEIEVLEKTFEKLNYNLTGEIIKKYREINNNLWNQYVLGEIDINNAFTVRFELLFDSLVVKVNGQKIEKIHKNFFNQGHKLIEGAFDLCQTLEKIHDLYIISNALQDTQEMRLKLSGLSRFFKDIFTSDKIGTIKPSVSFFKEVLKRISVKNTEELLIVGNSLETDIKDGFNANIDICWYNPNNKDNNSTIIPTYEIKHLNELLKIV